MPILERWNSGTLPGLAVTVTANSVRDYQKGYAEQIGSALEELSRRMALPPVEYTSIIGGKIRDSAHTSELAWCGHDGVRCILFRIKLPGRGNGTRRDGRLLIPSIISMDAAAILGALQRDGKTGSPLRGVQGKGEQLVTEPLVQLCAQGLALLQEQISQTGGTVGRGRLAVFIGMILGVTTDLAMAEVDRLVAEGKITCEEEGQYMVKGAESMTGTTSQRVAELEAQQAEYLAAKARLDELSQAESSVSQRISTLEARLESIRADRVAAEAVVSAGEAAALKLQQIEQFLG